MSRKDKFLRQCRSCGKFSEKHDLIRLTEDFVTKEVKLNDKGNIFGRSVYICKNTECIENAFKKKKSARSFLAKVPDELKKLIYTVLND